MTDSVLPQFLVTSLTQDSTQTAVAIYADRAAQYGRIVDVLNIGAANGIKMVLATRPGATAPVAVAPVADADTQTPVIK